MTQSERDIYMYFQYIDQPLKNRFPAHQYEIEHHQKVQEHLIKQIQERSCGLPH